MQNNEILQINALFKKNRACCTIESQAHARKGPSCLIVLVHKKSTKQIKLLCTVNAANRVFSLSRLQFRL